MSRRADGVEVTEPRWSVRCNDPFGRDRALTVLVEDERIVLVPPPGAAAVLSAKQARGLGLALDQAAVRTVQDRIVRDREAC